ncbi:aldehyde dehydrogenase family 2 member B7,mitochondrial [Planoprotostelium fungivorum]|uniref:Aldehyde dehydrogenase family 2 member B7,mitochondrial n=1 Tax=Planoprotostelium fungivorum TaxID=1890364 RepID=A0A2P6NE68_9EUKA|nr:aldehyde dehydrogenase family 2 member B7,mitochondrial [Planoprotostelium fungivorum]
MLSIAFTGARGQSVSLSLRSFGCRSRKFSTEPQTLAQRLSGHHLINGQLVSSSAKFPVHSPATGALVGHAAKGDASTIDSAVSSSKAAQKKWAERPVKERAALVAQCAQVLRAHSEELAKLTSLETGKALRTESRVEAGVCSDAFTFFAGLGSEIKGEVIPWNPNSITFTQRYPMGVVAAVIPWNAPLMLFSLKCAPALVCGNSVVLKSAEEAPFGVLRVVELLNTVLPPGLVNCISGFGPDCGGPLVAHRDVAKISFTGSVDTGKIIYKAAADKLAPITLELGGKSPMLVMADADIDRAVDGAIVGSLKVSVRFTRQGQSCSASSRIFVHSSVHDQFVEKLKQKVNEMKMGNPLDDATDIGTIISRSQFDKVKKYIELGKGLPGVQAHECSQLPTDSAMSSGFFVRPVIFTGITNDTILAQEEIFGPVCCILKWDDFDKVLEEANCSSFGLAASVWTKDLKMALKATQKLEAGIVQVNQNAVLQPNLPIGGWKESGLGVEGSLDSMLQAFTQSKTISINMN